jgi:(1->4)-alpha-D-glucan 1-alpha-D-glucosylmutase
MLARTGWREAHVCLPPGSWEDVLTGARHGVAGDGPIASADLFTQRPVALLLRSGA